MTPIKQYLSVPTYLVELDTPLGKASIEVPSFLGLEAASRRAHLCAVAKGWGDLPSVKVSKVTIIIEGEELVNPN